jgi:hypothetical protein
MRAAATAAAAAVVVVVVGGCVASPVSAFEDFYQATTRKDAVAFRALLCEPAQAAVAGADDDALLQAFAVTRVVQHVSVLEQTDARATLDVQDATGQHTTVTLERTAAKSWCIGGVAASKP